MLWHALNVWWLMTLLSLYLFGIWLHCKLLSGIETVEPGRTWRSPGLVFVVPKSLCCSPSNLGSPDRMWSISCSPQTASNVTQLRDRNKIVFTSRCEKTPHHRRFPRQSPSSALLNSRCRWTNANVHNQPCSENHTCQKFEARGIQFILQHRACFFVRVQFYVTYNDANVWNWVGYKWIKAKLLLQISKGKPLFLSFPQLEYPVHDQVFEPLLPVRWTLSC